MHYPQTCTTPELCTGAQNSRSSNWPNTWKVSSSLGRFSAPRRLQVFAALFALGKWNMSVRYVSPDFTMCLWLHWVFMAEGDASHRM